VTELRSILPRVPHEPGVYRFIDADGAVLYVGKAKDLRKRVSSYFRGGVGGPDGRIAEMVARARDVEWVVTRSEAEALLLEDNFIKQARPPFNLRLRDDKSYPYIEISLRDQWPRVRFFRGDHLPGNLYFGPYANAKKVRETLELIGRIFPYRKCKGIAPGRPSGSPCLQHFIKRSLSPCDDRCTPEEYREVIDEVTEFLRGHMKAVERRIAKDMEAAAEAQEFEKAALLRDRLAAVRHIAETQIIHQEGAGDADVIGLHQGDPGGNAQVFRVRDGSLVDRQPVYLENTSDRERRTVLEEFLMEFYWEGGAIPPMVVVDADEGTEDVAALLSAKRGAKVTVRRAQRGPMRRLLDLANRNALLAAAAESERLAQKLEARREALVRLRDALNLPGIPLRIECYDISNLGETNAVGSMVVFEDGRPKRAHYRKFAIRDVIGQDDFGMMRQIIERRFCRLGSAAEAAVAPVTVVTPAAAVASVAADVDDADGDVRAVGGGARAAHANGDRCAVVLDAAEADRSGEGVEVGGYDESFAARPDLVIVDGGKGQLSAALDGLKAVGLRDVPVVSLAKQREEVFVPGRSAPLALPADDPASLLLQRVRDEAHRFAVTYHRQKRSAQTRQSAIFDELPGVGASRRRKILEYFGSPERFLAASRQELESVPGLPPKVARGIYAHLHKAG
jgi:excinuclease ABC subunit C